MVGDEEIARLCGYITLRSFYSTNNRMTLQFYSDHIEPYRGFHIRYSGTESIGKPQVTLSMSFMCVLIGNIKYILKYQLMFILVETKQLILNNSK